MPRLLLVARNPGLAYGLGSASDDIIEVRPSLVGRLPVTPGMADVVVIEQERPDEALITLDMLRAGGLMAPALLVASARPEWADFDPGSRASVAVLDPPITQDRLGQSVGSTSGLPDAEHVVPGQPREEPEPEAATNPGATWDDDVAAEQVLEAGPEAEPLPPGPHVPDHVEVVFSDALTLDQPFGADTYADPWEHDEPRQGAPGPPSELDVESSSPDEDLPIAAAAADASAGAEDVADLVDVDDPDDVTEDATVLPDGPVDLEPPDDPYATATHVELEDAEPQTQPGFEVDASEEPESSPDADSEGTADPGPGIELAVEPDTAEAEAEEDPATEQGTDEVDPEPAAEVVTEAEADVEDEPGAEPDAAVALEGATDDEAPDVEAADADGADAEVTTGSSEVEDAEPERVLDTAMLAIPTAAPMRQPEEIRLGTPARDAVPAVVLYDDEEGLTVADGTPSPAAWHPEATEPVVAWQGTARDAHVYAEMASLMVASGELLADEPEVAEATGGDVDEDVPSVDLSQVFGETRFPAEPELLADLGPASDTATDLGAAPDGEDVTDAGQVPEPRLHIEMVDLRDQLPEDPRSTASLVRALLARSHEVYGVSEAGALVVADALARTGAGAGALLLPDGDTWRVAAGEGLRRLEHRYVLSSDSWLVTTIASRHKGVIIDRTDVARRPLAGAPLAAHKHLVAAPVRAVAGILLIARDDDPGFGERDLLSLARLAEASAGILASALDARQLARLLGDIRDQDDRAAADRIDYGL